MRPIVRATTLPGSGILAAIRSAVAGVGARGSVAEASGWATSEFSAFSFSTGA
jgi:hypothetical protein